MSKILLIIFLISISLFCKDNKIKSKKSSHQRLGVEKKINHKIGTSLNFTFTPQIYQNKEEQYYSSLYFEMFYKYKNFFTIGSMYDIDFLNTKHINKSHNDFDYDKFFSNGDLLLYINFRQKVKDLRIYYGLSYLAPVGFPYDYKNKDYIASSGFHQNTFSITISKILDPIILKFYLAYNLIYPRELYNKKYVKYGNIDFNFNLIEVLNDKVSYNVGLNNSVSLPQYIDGKRNNNITYYSFSIVFSINFAISRKYNINLGVNKNLTNIDKGPRINLKNTLDFEF